MDNYQDYISSIVIKNDWIAYCIFFGGILAIMLGLTLFSKKNPLSDITKYLGVLFIFIGFTNLDLWLFYTNIMLQYINLNNFSDFLILCIPPLVYLVLKSSFMDRRFNLKEDWVHFLFPFIYLCNHMLYFLQPRQFKILAFLKYNYPDLEITVPQPNFNIDPLYIATLNSVWISLSLLIYSFLSFKYLKYNNLISQVFSKSNIQNKQLLIRRNLLWCILMLVVFIIIKSTSKTDSMDYLLGLAISTFVVSTVIFIIHNSQLFERKWIADKYETSGLKSDHKFQDVEKIKDYLAESKFYTRKDASLKNLSLALNIPSNYISQTINSQLKINFNQLINEYRIEESKKVLIDPNYSHLNIEGIAYELGYKSKSTFYVAFKNHTGITPKKYISAHSKA